MDNSNQCGTILLNVVFYEKGDIKLQYTIGFSFMAFVPTILAYLVLSLLSLGVMYFFKKKSDQDIKKLEERQLPKE